MALVVKQGVQLANTTNSVVSQNINFLSPLGFRFTMTRTPNLNYFASQASIPAISMNEVNEVQEKFEENVKISLNTNVNPFELIYEGELVKQG